MTLTHARTHAWRIDEREYARHEQRRGRRYAYETLDPARTALVVIDLVDFFVRENPYAAGTVPVVNRLAAAVRATGGLVAWVVPAAAEPDPTTVEFFGAEVATLYSCAGEPVSELDVRAEDPVVSKSAYSAFFPGTSVLPDLLSARGIDTVVITGTVTNVCVESSVRDARQQGYRVVLVADGCAAIDDVAHNATLTTVYRSFGDVRTASDVCDLIGVPG